MDIYISGMASSTVRATLSIFMPFSYTMFFLVDLSSHADANVPPSALTAAHAMEASVMEGQVVRSICPWSAGVEAETSIVSAYLDIIQGAG